MADSGFPRGVELTTEGGQPTYFLAKHENERNLTGCASLAAPWIRQWKRPLNLKLCCLSILVLNTLKDYTKKLAGSKFEIVIVTPQAL